LFFYRQYKKEFNLGEEEIKIIGWKLERFRREIEIKGGRRN
jgi:hypothetical protein